jgi:hypothetical protein
MNDSEGKKVRDQRSTLILMGGFGLIVIILVIFGLFLVNFLKETADRAFSPLEQANQDIRTEIAQVLHPTPTILPDPVTIIHEIRALARLETIQYTVEKVITAETGQGAFEFLFGDRLLFVAHGYVIAGIDLGKMSSQDMVFDQGSLVVRLPDPEVFVATLDNEQSYVYDREMGILTQGNQDLETNARQVAEQAILEAALADGILDLARSNGENYILRLLAGLGFDDVLFVYPTAQP